MLPLLLSFAASPDPGAPDENGCHKNQQTGEYHSDGKPANSEGPPVKKSDAGICHERGSTYYD